MNDTIEQFEFPAVLAVVPCKARIIHAIDPDLPEMGPIIVARYAAGRWIMERDTFKTIDDANKHVENGQKWRPKGWRIVRIMAIDGGQTP